MSLADIRTNERLSHIDVYSNNILYHEGSWLSKPVKTVMELLPHLHSQTNLRILDLGCGVGRNSIAIAKYFSSRSIHIDCVDILELAIEKLRDYSREYNVSQSIHGTTSSIEAFPIAEDTYHMILAVSALEHIASPQDLISKLQEIQSGIKQNGIVCLVMNTSVLECDHCTGAEIPAQFETNLPTNELLSILNQIFDGWQVLKTTLSKQKYTIPRPNGPSDLESTVVTYVVRK